MLKQFILLIFVLSSASHLFAQALPANPAGGCVIKYDYDAGGNRIKRHKYCWAAGGYVQRPGQSNSTSSTSIEMQIFPNPASSTVSIQINTELANAIVELQEMSGKLIASKPIEGNMAMFDIQNLSQAAYLVVLKRRDSKDILVRKLVKE